MATITKIWMGSTLIERSWPFGIVGEELHVFYSIEGSDLLTGDDLLGKFKGYRIIILETVLENGVLKEYVPVDENGNVLGTIEELDAILANAPHTELYVNGEKRAVQFPQSPGTYFFPLVLGGVGTYSIYVKTNGGVSNTLSIEGVEGVDIPDGCIGVAAITLPSSEQVITYDSRIPSRDQPEKNFHPKIYLVSKCRENRQAQIRFSYYDKNGAPIRENQFTYIAKSVNIPDHPDTPLLHAYDRVIIDFSKSPHNVHSTALPVYLNVYPFKGVCQIGVTADITMDYFGTEKESDVYRYPAMVEYELRDIAPPAGKFTVDIKLVPHPSIPGAYNIHMIRKNNTQNRISAKTYMNHAFTIDGEPVHSSQYADWMTEHLTLKPGEQYEGFAISPTPPFVPEPGRIYNICFLDEGQTATISTPEGGTETVEIVQYSYS